MVSTNMTKGMEALINAECTASVILDGLPSDVPLLPLSSAFRLADVPVPEREEGELPYSIT